MAWLPSVLRVGSPSLVTASDGAGKRTAYALRPWCGVYRYAITSSSIPGTPRPVLSPRTLGAPNEFREQGGSKRSPTHPLSEVRAFSSVRKLSSSLSSTQRRPVLVFAQFTPIQELERSS